MTDEKLKEIVLKYKDDIAYPYDALIDIIGYDALVAIVEMFAGSQIYISTKKRIFSECIAKQIAAEFNGKNYSALAKKYDLCTNSVRKIAADSTVKK